MSTCRGCGAKIIWIKTKEGKNMPCNLNHYFVKQNCGFPESFITKSGQMVYGTPVELPEEGCVLAFRPHWPDCPAAQRFRDTRPNGKKQQRMEGFHYGRF